MTQRVFYRDLLRDLRSKADGYARILERHRPGIMRGKNPEHAHKMRVAGRRLRETLRILDRLALDPKRRVGRLRIAFRQFTHRLGRIRELDVALQALGRSRSPIPAKIRGEACRVILPHLERQIRIESEHLRRWLIRKNSINTRLRHLCRRIQTFRPRPSRGSNFAERMVEERLRLARARFGRIGDAADIRRLHRFRISVKKLRYATEILFPFLSKKWGNRLGQMKDIQSVLGRIHDDHVTARLFRNSGAGMAKSKQAAVRLACETLDRDYHRQMRRLAGKLGHLL